MWDTGGMRRVRAIVTADEAHRLGLTGWVRNRVDGAVELEAAGEPARVSELLAWCAHGPPSARVVRVTVEELASAGDEEGFTIRRTE